MKRIGIISGINPKTALHYYEGVNKIVGEKLGAIHSADCVIRIPDANSYRKQIAKGHWSSITIGLCLEARDLFQGNECRMVAIASNTLNMVVPYIQEREIPIMDIGESVAREAKKRGVTRALLLGTRTVMEENFIKDRLKAENIEIVDDICDRDIMVVNRAINEKTYGYDVMSSSRALKQICLETHEKNGIDGVIVCSFELSSIFDPTFSSLLLNKYKVQMVDSADAQIKALANFALS